MIAVKDDLRVWGKAKLTFTDVLTGKVRVRRGKNRVVNVGLAHLWGMCFGVSGYTAMSYLAVGSGTGEPASTDTTLDTELDRNQITSAGIAITNGQVVISVQFTTADAVDDIGEVGILNAASGGTLLCRVLLDPPEAKANTETMLVEYTLTIEAV